MNVFYLGYIYCIGVKQAASTSYTYNIMMDNRNRKAKKRWEYHEEKSLPEEDAAHGTNNLA